MDQILGTERLLSQLEALLKRLECLEATVASLSLDVEGLSSRVGGLEMPEAEGVPAETFAYRPGYFARKRMKEKAIEVSDDVMAELRLLVEEAGSSGDVKPDTHLLWVDEGTGTRLLACIRALIGTGGMTDDEVKNAFGAFMGLSIVWNQAETKVVDMRAQYSASTEVPNA